MIRTIPKAIRYQPKDSKLCFLTKDIKNFMAISETTKETTVPVIKKAISVASKLNPSIKNFNVSRAEAPAITGIARKKENSAAAVLFTPTVDAPRIVEPERDVPGTTERV